MKRRLSHLLLIALAVAYVATWAWGRPAAVQAVEQRHRDTAQDATLEALEYPRRQTLVDTFHPRVTALPIVPGLLLVRSEYPDAAGDGARRTDLVGWFVSGVRPIHRFSNGGVASVRR